VTALPILSGQAVVLVPRTPGCARECWSQPTCVVVSIAPPEVTVRLPDGREITTREHNVVRATREAPPQTGCNEVAGARRRGRAAVRGGAVMSVGTVFAALYAAHLVADHWVQTQRQAVTKGLPGWPGRIGCAAHVATYTATWGAPALLEALIPAFPASGAREG
jgi:hypothetical protein